MSYTWISADRLIPAFTLNWLSVIAQPICQFLTTASTSLIISLVTNLDNLDNNTCAPHLNTTLI